MKKLWIGAIVIASAYHPGMAPVPKRVVYTAGDPVFSERSAIAESRTTLPGRELSFERERIVTAHS